MTTKKEIIKKVYSIQLKKKQQLAKAKELVKIYDTQLKAIKGITNSFKINKIDKQKMFELLEYYT